MAMLAILRAIPSLSDPYGGLDGNGLDGGGDEDGGGCLPSG